jgi:hypothetical protein
MTTHVYSEGQVWSYRTRPGEEGSTVVIHRIESYPEEGDVFHIAIEEVRLRNHRVDGGLQTAMRHVPVSRATLDASVLDLLRIAAPEEGWREGYEVWQQAFANGDAGVFDIPVADILGYIETVVASAGE